MDCAVNCFYDKLETPYGFPNLVFLIKLGK